MYSPALHLEGRALELLTVTWLPLMPSGVCVLCVCVCLCMCVLCVEEGPGRDVGGEQRSDQWSLSSRQPALAPEVGSFVCGCFMC